MTAKTFTWQSNGGGDDLSGEDLEHTAEIDGGAIRWATVTDEYDDDRPYTGASEKRQDVADFIAHGPIESAPIKVLDGISAALAAAPAWMDPLRLRYAAAEGDLTATRGLLRIGGAYKNVVVRGKTALSAALEAERIDTATCLLDGGCDPNVRLDGGETALHVAARHCKTAASATLLRALLAAGAVIEARSADGQTPLLAGLCGHLCKEGVLILVEDRKAINTPAEDGTTPLVAEARGWCRPSVVRALLGAGADVNLRSKDGWSPLLWAITKHDMWLVKMLIDARADVNVVGQPHKHGQPPRSALALAQSFAGTADPGEAASSTQAALKRKSVELANQIVDALKAAGAVDATGRK
jgi:ankyrin repeat protein